MELDSLAKEAWRADETGKQLRESDLAATAGVGQVPAFDLAGQVVDPAVQRRSRQVLDPFADRVQMSGEGRHFAARPPVRPCSRQSTDLDGQRSVTTRQARFVWALIGIMGWP